MYHNISMYSAYCKLFCFSSEPRIRWSQRVTWKLKNSIPYSCYDGTGQTDYHQGEASVLWLLRKHHFSQEILHALQAVWRTIDETGAWENLMLKIKWFSQINWLPRCTSEPNKGFRVRFPIRLSLAFFGISKIILVVTRNNLSSNEKSGIVLSICQ